LTPHELEAQYRLFLERPPLLVTFHPVTLEYEQTEWQVSELLAALDECDMPIIFTVPNADTNGRIIKRMIEDFVRRHSSAQMADNLGTQGYFSMMAVAGAMVGNSSSGIIEAPSFRLPVVNIGTRQGGRVRAKNVIDVGCNQSEIVRGIKNALSHEFRSRLREVINPHGDGRASEIIVRRLKEVALNDELIIKRFADIPSGSH